ncbi:uncharacterized protein KRP23_9475 [Phytophthora ramorum]|uniref:uncharacterized protein n=1 Tax=Phytophthora ramorum TaxID=164328 RepID=UPI0030A34375|nr:hypothetical protein KRP23_9475 [Phytophthora ramorum]
MEMVQVLSLLEPISSLNQAGQGENCNQCNVLLGLYKLQISLLDTTQSLKDCRSIKDEQQFFRAEELSNLASTTRTLLHKMFHRVFFRRYTDRNVVRKCSYTFEIQLLLHRNFKNPDGALKWIVILSNLQAGASQQVVERHYTKVRHIVLDSMRKIMVAVDSTPSMPEVVVPPPAAIFPKGIMTLFVDTAGEILPQSLTTATALHEQRIDDEFERWLTTTTTVQGASFNDLEPVLTFWKCQQDIGTFRLLPLVTRVFFSLSSSSAHIERGFGTAGRMVKPQRNSLAPYSVDMTTLFNCERSYVNIA